MKILLLVSAFNGLTQRAWCALRAAGHDVTVELAPVHSTPDSLVAVVHAVSPELILCPFLKHRVPAEIWRKWPTVIVHPGPVGDRGPSSLDYAIQEQEGLWGVTALSAVEEMDAGPVWASRTFPMPEPPTSKAALYNGPVADAAMSCMEEVVAKAADPGFQPVSQEDMPRPVTHARTRPSMRRADREFDWSQPAEQIVRRIHAADSAPGVRTEIEGRTVYVYDAAVAEGRPRRFYPGTVIGRGQDAIAVATGDKTVWIGHVKEPRDAGGAGVKLPATTVFDEPVPDMPVPAPLQETTYRRVGDVGHLDFRVYNGAMSTAQCERIAAALETALAQDTRVLVLSGSPQNFSNGIHLNVIEAAPDPAMEAWRNINAINRLCTALVSCTGQLTIAAFTGGAGAGGVMLGLAADIVVARRGVVLNPYYDMGLYGSELHTYTLPRRVGHATATRLLTEKLPVDAEAAAGIGLVDAVGPRDWDRFRDWLADLAASYAEPEWHAEALAAKSRVLQGTRPPAYYAAAELAEMAKDFFDDRSGFAAARRAFVGKTAPTETPTRLARHRWSLVGDSA
ncbi:putative two-component system hydrogenase maturation factor HypX/HoxX [Stackebrandtia albiflava]|uniref:Putative two-component system hydrogenase maturation factor HypX/HoxX n=1 Tax=Stackebrandtia albiflava TaxID=406432 RepID=A0A562UL32_9ACTN|nr:hydrogenase maturation protein [Stackebrandtia albiflava]TWJ06319.1 putative two-component system hydrogenase maturation factor HypX/HoxX [Stackebrandtia albiflava]